MSLCNLGLSYIPLSNHAFTLKNAAIICQCTRRTVNDAIFLHSPPIFLPKSVWTLMKKQQTGCQKMQFIFNFHKSLVLTWKLNQEDLVKPFSSGNSNGLNCDLFEFLQPSFDRPNFFFSVLGHCIATVSTWKAPLLALNGKTT